MGCRVWLLQWSIGALILPLVDAATAVTGTAVSSWLPENGQMVTPFRLQAPYDPRGDQPEAIAGLVAGASKGEGKGNDFLSNIRECDAIIHVVRCFDNDDIVHSMGKVDPVRDIGVIETELILADIQSAEQQLDRLRRLDAADDARENPEHAAFRATRHFARRRRLLPQERAPAEEVEQRGGQHRATRRQQLFAGKFRGCVQVKRAFLPVVLVPFTSA